MMLELSFYDRHVFIVQATEGYLHGYFQLKFVIHESAFTQMLLGSMSWHRFSTKALFTYGSSIFYTFTKKIEIKLFFKKKKVSVYSGKREIK